MDVSGATFFPPEIWEQIFTNLDSYGLKVIRLTCRRFRDIVSNCPILREQLTVIFLDEIIMDHTYNPLPLPPAARAILVCSKLVEVSAWWPGFGEKLTVLHLHRCEDYSLKMLRFTPNLKDLNLHNSAMDARDSEDDMNFKLDRLDKLSLTFESPEVLNIVKQIVPKSLLIFKMDSNESDVEAQRCFVQFIEIYQDSLKKLQLPPVSRMLEEISFLPRLKLTTAKIVPSANCYFDQAIQLPGLVRLARAQPTIEKLVVWSVPLDETTQLDLYQTLPKLKSLDLDGDRTTLQLCLPACMAGLEYLS